MLIPAALTNTVFYQNQLPVRAMNFQMKQEMLTYLLQKGAEINNKQLKKGLLEIALGDSDFELADFLLKKGADTKNIQQNKNLKNLAASSKNVAIILWVSKNTIAEYANKDFEEFLEIVETQFPNKSTEIDEVLNIVKKDRIIRKFNKLGDIGVNEMALILAAKMSKKETKKNTIFILDHDLNLLPIKIKSLIENQTEEKLIKFQIIYHNGIHACCGEFLIDKTGEVPVVNYLHLDSLPEITPFYTIITLNFVKQISPLAKIKVSESQVKLQKGKGCTYMSIEAARMLTTVPERDYAVNLMEYMKQKGQKKEVPLNIFKSFSDQIDYSTTKTLPARFLRSMQYTKDEEDKSNPSVVHKSLESFIFNTNEKETIVNKKGETAEASIKKDLLVNKGLMTTLNLRTERKMKQYKEEVKEFISEKNILEPEFINQINQFKAEGFKSFCDEKIIPSNENALRL